jgi:hypothetical protein
VFVDDSDGVVILVVCIARYVMGQPNTKKRPVLKKAKHLEHYLRPADSDSASSVYLGVSVFVFVLCVCSLSLSRSRSLFSLLSLSVFVFVDSDGVCCITFCLYY